MQVEATLFKVPRSYFEQFDAFRKTYLLDAQDGEVLDGCTDQQPLRLEGIDAAEFRCLLKAITRK